MAFKMAIIQTGGKQYRVSPGTVLTIEKLPATAKSSGPLRQGGSVASEADSTSSPQVGSKITFDKVLLLDDGKDVKIGTPYVSGAKIGGEIIDEGRGKKVLVMTYKPKTRYRRKYGHRQPYTKIRII